MKTSQDYKHRGAIRLQKGKKFIVSKHQIQIKYIIKIFNNVITHKVKILLVN